jgi:multicomponent Na+:H+ antiporter subunit D
MPWTMGAFALAGLSLIGVPGTAGFVSKWYLIAAALEQGPVGIAMVVIVLLSSLLAVVYVWRVVETAWFGQLPDASASVHEAPLSMLIVTWLAALANLYFGFAPALPVDLASGAARTLLEHLL